MEEMRSRAEATSNPTIVREPKREPPSQAEIDRHSVTHLPPQPDWCLCCALARSRDRDHSNRHITLEEPRMQFGFMFTRADGTQIEEAAEEQPWATTLFGIDEATKLL